MFGLTTKMKNIAKFIPVVFLASLIVVACETSANNNKVIETGIGNLSLTYQNGTSTLKGVLSRFTPCVDWNVKVSGPEDILSSNIQVDIFNKNKGQNCIQVLGKPQDISVEIPNVSENTLYSMNLEGKNLFSGKI